MLLDLRAIAIAVTLVLASIVVAAADNARSDERASSAASLTDKTADARPIRVILPAPWEPATSNAQAALQK